MGKLITDDRLLITGCRGLTSIAMLNLRDMGKKTFQRKGE
jgi:hypothetical protein